MQASGKDGELNPDIFYRDYSTKDIIEKIPYDLNGFGYRSKKFDKDNEVLILGCSQTFGLGMHDAFTWPEIFCKSINKKYSRIAAPGDSINGQVYKAFNYFEEIGHPKIVVGIFPIFRLEYTKIINKFITQADLKKEEKDQNPIGIAYIIEDYNIKISQMPYDPQFVLPQEFLVFYNFMFLKMLEQYCESHGIKFIWSIYDDHDIDFILESNPKTLKNYLKTSHLTTELEFLKKERNTSEIIEKIKENELKHEQCYQEFKDHKLYNWAADFDKKNYIGHWGIHLHHHIADLVIERYKEIENC